MRTAVCSAHTPPPPVNRSAWAASVHHGIDSHGAHNVEWESTLAVQVAARCASTVGRAVWEVPCPWPLRVRRTQWREGNRATGRESTLGRSGISTMSSMRGMRLPPALPLPRLPPICAVACVGPRARWLLGCYVRTSTLTPVQPQPVAVTASNGSTPGQQWLGRLLLGGMRCCAGAAGELVAADPSTATVRRVQLHGDSLRWVSAAAPAPLPPAARVLALARVVDARCALCVSSCCYCPCSCMHAFCTTALSAERAATPPPLLSVSVFAGSRWAGADASHARAPQVAPMCGVPARPRRHRRVG
jgi:hypothetical protein